MRTDEVPRGEGWRTCGVGLGCEDICDGFFCRGDEEKNERKKGHGSAHEVRFMCVSHIHIQ